MDPSNISIYCHRSRTAGNRIRNGQVWKQGKNKAQKKGLINQTPIYNPKINLE